MSNIFYNIEPKVINTELACLIGLNEAIVLQQLHYWLEKNKATATNYQDGHYWTYGTVQEYRDRDFKFWSFNTVKRTLTRLVELGFLIKGNFNKMKMDHTNWYTIDYQALDEWIKNNSPAPDYSAPQQSPPAGQPNMGQSDSPYCPNPSAQNEPTEQPKMSQSKSPYCPERTAQDEPAEKPIVGRAIQEIKKEINNQRLDNKTNSQRSAPPSAGESVSNKNTGENVSDQNTAAFEYDVLEPAELFFDEFWKLYPRKESKQQAKKAWMKLNPGQELFDLIANALEYRSQTKEWLAENGRYIPHPATWLNGRRWEDEVDPQKMDQSSLSEERYGGILIDGKPLDPVQRRQMEYIEKQIRERAYAGEAMQS